MNSVAVTRVYSSKSEQKCILVPENIQYMLYTSSVNKYKQQHSHSPMKYLSNPRRVKNLSLMNTSNSTFSLRTRRGWSRVLYIQGFLWERYKCHKLIHVVGFLAASTICAYMLSLLSILWYVFCFVAGLRLNSMCRRQQRI